MLLVLSSVPTLEKFDSYGIGKHASFFDSQGATTSSTYEKYNMVFFFFLLLFFGDGDGGGI